MQMRGEMEMRDGDDGTWWVTIYYDAAMTGGAGGRGHGRSRSVGAQWSGARARRPSSEARGSALMCDRDVR